MNKIICSELINIIFTFTSNCLFNMTNTLHIKQMNSVWIKEDGNDITRLFLHDNLRKCQDKNTPALSKR